MHPARPSASRVLGWFSLPPLPGAQMALSIAAVIAGRRMPLAR
jgi:hypothetical protein